MEAKLLKSTIYLSRCTWLTLYDLCNRHAEILRCLAINFCNQNVKKLEFL